MTKTLAVAPWRLFTVAVRAVHRISPSFARITFTGADLDLFADNGYDLRLKLVFPLPEHGFTHLPTGPDWYQQWRALPEDARNPVRTYTARAVRQHQHELDVDFALHGDNGPASRWALQARPGHALALLGPDARYDGDHGGVEFRPPADIGSVLLAGDETATPAISAILERLPWHTRGEALLEVPHPADTRPLAAPPDMTVTWLPRGRDTPGSRLVPAVTAAADRLLPARTPVPADLADGDTNRDMDRDMDRDILWEIPDARPSTPLYAWLAGEAGVIRTLRRQLVSDRGIDRRSVAFMGYWRLRRPDQG